MMIKYISSVTNDQVKHIVNLQNKAYRQEHGQFIAQGTRTCQQLIEKYTPVVIYMTEKYYKIGQFAQLEEISVAVTDRVMEKMSTSQQPSGICAIFKIPQEQPLPQTGPGLVLVEMNDPGNLGTLIRTASAMNISNIVLVGGVDPYNPKVIQSTAGCITHVNLYQASWQEVCNSLQQNLCALVVKDGQNPASIDLSNRFLVVGNEAHGLTPEQIRDCHTSMTIPMPGHAESLNAAVAGSIGLYIMMQQL